MGGGIRPIRGAEYGPPTRSEEGDSPSSGRAVPHKKHFGYEDKVF